MMAERKISNESRGFRGVWIPKEYWLDPNLKIMEVVFITEIESLDNGKGCYASNKYFSEFFGISKGRCSQIINNLSDKGYIKIDYDREGKQVKKRTMKVVRKLTTPYLENYRPYLENDKENNTSSNTSNNDQSDLKKIREQQLEEDFNKLWKLYPRKEGKKKAFEAYKRAIKNGTTNKEIQTGIVNYLAQIRVQRTSKQYIKQGSTWFNGECWNDEYNVGQERSPVNPKTVPSSAPANRTMADLEREQRESRRDAFPIQYKEHPEWFNEETIKSILEEFPELREKVAEIDRARATSDRNTA
ncbi:helix-turn-helix domain-containing protein [Lactobacillus murinus]|uniref:Helix-turn-helix domain-containing protein n=2 Tax=Ligilactobacillus murinus TaxID=1622 RepID=A0AAE6WJL4_9LACO|nr:helix-turn-helix domain-containing protein [Ligilactobacillus murinus]NEF84256.1 helix-turn-helix domain-containing protein [Ligilactobacillus murinus]NEF86544.1 helix-turn-helix domain-containing protein [Ligilactobacillus murinus]NEF88873.1 helix-turn-helix domain-containing protein [Ligilactobacillus murinus]NEF91141.1 helix-turn-helix domain-containing protein [Ligilactobacillus murinus]